MALLLNNIQELQKQLDKSHNCMNEWVSCEKHKIDTLIQKQRQRQYSNQKQIDTSINDLKHLQLQSGVSTTTSTTTVDNDHHDGADDNHNDNHQENTTNTNNEKNTNKKECDNINQKQEHIKIDIDKLQKELKSQQSLVQGKWLL